MLIVCVHHQLFCAPPVFQIIPLESFSLFLFLQLLSFIHACSTFFHQGSDLCQDLDPFLKKLAENVSLLSLV